MNWINKIKKLGESIKKNINKKFPTKSERDSSAWTSCCKGPILKTELEENLFCCPHCNKHFRISPAKRFDIIFGKNNYEIFKTPIPQDDPLKWKIHAFQEQLDECNKFMAGGAEKNIISFGDSIHERDAVQQAGKWLPNAFNLHDPYRKDLLFIDPSNWWPDDLNNLYNSGYVYHFNAIPKNHLKRDAGYWIQRVFNELYEDKS